MSWHRVDDGLHSHRKTRKVRRTHPEKRRDVAPFGIWALAGSWCGANRDTGGFIPLEVLEEWDDDAEDYAARLVSAGLWTRAESDGEVGYQFHDWEDYNAPTDSESGILGNHIRWHVKKATIKEGCPLCEDIASGDDRPDVTPDSGGESPPDVAPESPTLPIPNPSPTHTSDARAATFDDFWKMYPKKVGRGQAIKAWKAATKKAQPADIILALRSQLPSMAMQRRNDGDFRPNPATWLNGERWTDEIPGVTPGDLPAFFRAAGQ